MRKWCANCGREMALIQHYKSRVTKRWRFRFGCEMCGANVEIDQ